MADQLTYLDKLLSKIIAVDGTEMEPCGRLNLVAGAGVNLTGTNDQANGQCNVVITASNLATLAASEVTNDSSVSGATAADALDTLDAGKADKTTTITAGLGLTGGGDFTGGDITIAISTAGATVGQFLSLTGAETVGWADGSSLSAPTGGDAYKVAIANATEDDLEYSNATIQGDVLSISGEQIVDASSGLVFGDAANTGSMTLEVDAVESIYLAAGGSNIVSFSDNGLSMQGSRFVNVGGGWLGLGVAKPSTGTVRMAHGSSFYGLNDAGDTDVALMDWGVTTTDVLTMPGPVQVGSGTFGSTGDIRLPIGGVISANTVTCTMGTSNQFVVVAAGGIILNNATSSNSSITAAGAVSSSSGGYTTQMVGSSAGYIEMSAITGQTREVRVGNNPTASVTGATLIVHGQNCVGATSTGGDALVRPGTGTSAGGNAELQSAAGATGNRVRVNDTGVLIVPSSTGSVQIGAAASADFGSGVGVIGIDEATTDPTGNPTSGGILYVENSTGKLVFRGKSGTITEIASA